MTQCPWGWRERRERSTQQANPKHPNQLSNSLAYLRLAYAYLLTCNFPWLCTLRNHQKSWDPSPQGRHDGARYGFSDAHDDGHNDDGHMSSRIRARLSDSSAEPDRPDDDGLSAFWCRPGPGVPSHDARGTPGSGGSANPAHGSASHDARGTPGCGGSANPAHGSANPAHGSANPAHGTTARRADGRRFGAVQAVWPDVHSSSRGTPAHGSVHDVRQLPGRPSLRLVGVPRHVTDADSYAHILCTS